MGGFKAGLFFVAVCIIVLWGATTVLPQSNPLSLLPDQPEEEEVLNRELWQFAKGTPYEVAEGHIKRVRQRGQTAAPAAVVLPNGWKIAPAGRQTEVGRLPEEAVAYAGHIVVLNTGYYPSPKKGKDEKVKPEEQNDRSQEISIVDPKSGEVVKVLRPGSLFPGAAVGPDGDLYVSGGYDQVVYRYDDRFELKKKYPVHGYAAGLAPIDPDHLAVVYLVTESEADYPKKHYGKGKLAVLNTGTGVVREIEAGYFPHTVRYQSGKLYVSVLGENKVNIYEYPAGGGQAVFKKSLAVGQAPQDLCPDPGNNRLYAVNTNSDSLSVIDTGKDEVITTINVGSRGYDFGSGPTSCAADGDRLFVTLAFTNSVAVFDKGAGTPLGSIPTGWYPTKVIVEKDRLAVLSAKGIKARRPNINGPQPSRQRLKSTEYILTLLRGTLGIIPGEQLEKNLSAWTRQVEEGAPQSHSLKGAIFPIKYVFFVVRENRTYDQVLGDLTWPNGARRGNGDPFLTLFGEKITPNAHKLASRFVTLDNFFANGEVSALGHSYTTSGYASPFLEWLANMQYSGRYRGYPFGTVPAVNSPKYLWDALDAKGLDYRIYGENYYLYTRAFSLIKEIFGSDSDQAQKFYARMMQVASERDRGSQLYKLADLFWPPPLSVAEADRRLQSDPAAAQELSRYLLGDDSLVQPILTDEKIRREFAGYFYHYPVAYRSWDLQYSDLDRVRVWREDFINQVKNGSLAPFHYIWLPNDHTGGIRSGSLSPDEFVAQNDAALGVVLKTISHYPEIWQNSLVLVTEDDAQNGPDHVDATRTVGLAAGPWVKRNTVVSDRYDQLSMLRTMEMLLGLPPLNQNDALAVPMFGIFSRKPDGTPYTLPPPPAPLSEADARRYADLITNGKKPPCREGR